MSLYQNNYDGGVHPKRVMFNSEVEDMVSLFSVYHTLRKSFENQASFETEKKKYVEQQYLVCLSFGILPPIVNDTT